MWNLFIKNPLISLLIIATFVAISKVLLRIWKGDSNNSDDDDQDGGISFDEPILDLPPGVTLPVDDKEPVTA